MTSISGTPWNSQFDALVAFGGDAVFARSGNVEVLYESVPGKRASLVTDRGLSRDFAAEREERIAKAKARANSHQDDSFPGHLSGWSDGKNWAEFTSTGMKVHLSDTDTSAERKKFLQGTLNYLESHGHPADTSGFTLKATFDIQA